MDSDRWSLLPRLLATYGTLLAGLKSAGATSVQIDEPCLALDLPAGVLANTEDYYRGAFAKLAKAGLPLHLTTYFAALEDNLPLAFSLPVASVHLDLVRAPQQLAAALPLIQPQPQPRQALSLGIVDGRNIWVNDFERSRALIDQAVAALGAERVFLAPSCSLLHVPVDATGETRMQPVVRSWLAFAVQKLDELHALAAGSDLAFAEHATNRAAIASRAAAESSRNEEVRAALGALTASDYKRETPYARRAEAQAASLRLPPLPTTTIGSFPQTSEVRKARAAWRSGQLPQVDYRSFLENETVRCLREQENASLDLLVHGEFERNDMVEYFGEQLQGFAFTQTAGCKATARAASSRPSSTATCTGPRP
jgi:5-methyltetrahydropteroyltriglutamate--homocysteine methyltransferase